jgi:hypothetical protein
MSNRDFANDQFVDSFLLFVEKIYAPVDMAIVLETIETNKNKRP